VADPRPEADPDVDPEALGPGELHAAKVNAQAKGTIHLVMKTP
jgi:hypothetical protein